MRREGLSPPPQQNGVSVRQVTHPTVETCGQTQQFAEHRPADRSAGGVCGGCCDQIDDVTLPSSQAECDPRLIAPLLFSKRSETLWSSIRGSVFHRLQLFMLRCGNRPLLFITSPHGSHERSGPGQVLETNMESVP